MLDLPKVLKIAVVHNAGAHSGEAVPEDETQRLYFGLLEIIDFECEKFGFRCDMNLARAPEPYSEYNRDTVISFLREHRDEIKGPLPSYLGMLAGAYNEVFND